MLKKEENDSPTSSPLNSPDAPAPARRHRRMMRSALNYRKVLEGTCVNDEEGEEMFLQCLSDEDPFSSVYDGKSGLGVYANPYMEVFNVAMVTAGIYPYKIDSDRERHRLNTMTKPMLYMDLSNVDTGTLEEESLSETSTGSVPELTEISTDVIQKVPVNRHLRSEVVTEIHRAESRVAPPTGSNKLPSLMKLHIDQAVDTQMEEWRREGKLLKNISKEAEDKTVHRLQEQACSLLTSKIQDYLTGKIKFNQPLPRTEVKKKRRKES